MTYMNLDLARFVFSPSTDVNSIGLGLGALSGVTTGTNNISIVTGAHGDGITTASNTFWLGGGATAIMSATGINSTPTVTIPGNLVVSGTFTSSGSITENGLTITATSGATLTIASGATLATSGAYSLTLTATGTTVATVPSGTNTLAALGVAQTWTALQTFTNSDIALLGSSTGYTTLTSANAGASNYTLTLPAVTDTVATLTGVGTTVSGYSTAFTNTGSTAATITGMAVTLAVGKYAFNGYLSVQCAATPGIKVNILQGGAGTSAFLCDTWVYSTTTITGQSNISAQSSNLFSAAVAATTVEFSGSCVVSTAGTITIQAAQNTSNATVLTIANGSYMSFTRIS